MTAQQPATAGAAYVAQCRRKLAACLDRIKHCLDQLSDEQVWWRPHPAMNSIANILLHLAGNLRQWVVACVPQAPDERDRPAEFAQRSSLSKRELLQRLEETVRQADAVLTGVTDAQLLEPRRVQGFDETVLSAVFDSVAHFNGHMQEIVYITRLQLGDAYRFAWAPATPEQGAPVPNT